MARTALQIVQQVCAWQGLPQPQALFSSTDTQTQEMAALLNEEIGVHLLVYDLDDLRGALKPDAQGRVPRGNLAAMRRLIEKDTV